MPKFRSKIIIIFNSTIINRIVSLGYLVIYIYIFDAGTFCVKLNNYLAGFTILPTHPHSVTLTNSHPVTPTYTHSHPPIQML